MNRAEALVSPEDNSSAGNRSFVYIILFALLLLLPTVQMGLFGWLCFSIPSVVLFYLYRWRFGLRFILTGTALAAAVGFFISSLAMVIFAAALIPLGYSLAQSGFRSDSPSLSGLKGTIVLCSCWILLLTSQTALTGINPVTEFLQNLDHDIEQALSYYRQSESVAPDTMALLEQSFFQMKTVFPKILPALMVCLVLLIVWSTMLLGNRLIVRFTRYRAWPDHQRWKLPDKLIWVLIGTALMAMVPIPAIRLAGINLLICFSLIYLFQGFSVLSFFLHRWHVPPLLRFFLYAMMLFQSFGTVLLLIAGVGDVWLDLRKLKISTGGQPGNQENQDNDG